MKKPVLGSMLVALLLSSVPAFAQFKNPVKAAKNLKELDRVVISEMPLSYVKGVRRYLPKITVKPAHAIEVPVGTHATTVLSIAYPKVDTRVTRDFYEFKGLSWITPTTEKPRGFYNDRWVNGGGKAVYEDQSTLARDVHAFYAQEDYSKRYIGPDGRLVALYVLPVDGVLYKPVGYKVPVVLNPDKYIVIYDVEAKTGKIADNIPEVCNLYKPAGEEESYGEFEDYEVEPGIGSWRPKDPAQYYKWQRNLMRNNPQRAEDWRNGNYPTRFESQDDLGNALHRFYGNDVPKVQKRFTQDVFNVYELPVEGIVYQGEGQREPTELFPSSYVVLYNENTGGQIVQRSTLENSFFFEFVK